MKRGPPPPRQSIIIHKMKVFDLLKSFSDSSIDLIVTDPPYESLERHRAGPPGGGKGTTMRLGLTKKSNNDWFPVFFNRDYPALFNEFYRVMRPQRHVYVMCDADTEIVLRHCAEQAGFYWWNTLIWRKVTHEDPNKIRTGMGYHYSRSHERIAFFEKRTEKYVPPPLIFTPRPAPPGKGRTLFDLSVPDVLDGHRALPDDYPTEKPTSILEKIVRCSSMDGEVLLDPFAGSGSLGAAAKHVGPRKVYLGDPAELSIFYMTHRFRGHTLHRQKERDKDGKLKKTNRWECSCGDLHDPS